MRSDRYGLKSPFLNLAEPQSSHLQNRTKVRMQMMYVKTLA